jgi:hypothetical protein
VPDVRAPYSPARFEATPVPSASSSTGTGDVFLTADAFAPGDLSQVTSERIGSALKPSKGAPKPSKSVLTKRTRRDRKASVTTPKAKTCRHQGRSVRQSRKKPCFTGVRAIPLPPPGPFPLPRVAPLGACIRLSWFGAPPARGSPTLLNSGI